jgi:7-cyano-7-deazaguanine tRNA-ribosyltransferase
VLIVAGLSLKNLHPRVWDLSSPYFLSDLQAVMVSYADFHRKPARRVEAMEHGLAAFLGLSETQRVYLDNGAFYFRNAGKLPRNEEYEEFVNRSHPDWYAAPWDSIPSPDMSDDAQRQCLERTMDANLAFQHNGYVPIVHVSRILDEYLRRLGEADTLRAKPAVALGGIVPNLLRAPRAMPYDDILAQIRRARSVLADRQLHVFGIGGTATLHLAALLEIDSADSSGWRNRAARGIVQLPGRGDRMVASMGKWRGREPNADEWKLLSSCDCPPCGEEGLGGLRAAGLRGFCHRATHNLAVLLREAADVETQLKAGTYAEWYEAHLQNSIYLPLVRRAAKWKLANQAGEQALSRQDKMQITADVTISPRKGNTS